jgi:hypothetical protein
MSRLDVTDEEKSERMHKAHPTFPYDHIWSDGARWSAPTAGFLDEPRLKPYRPVAFIGFGR